MWPAHIRQVNWIAILARLHAPMPLIVAETILDANDNPEREKQSVRLAQNAAGAPSRNETYRLTYHRFVKTTPKPNATKNNKGELVGPLLFEPLSDGVGKGAADVVAEADILMRMRMAMRG